MAPFRRLRLLETRVNARPGASAAPGSGSLPSLPPEPQTARFPFLQNPVITEESKDLHTLSPPRRGLLPLLTAGLVLKGRADR